MTTSDAPVDLRGHDALRPDELYRWGRLYEPIREIRSTDGCVFYHTMDLANGMTVHGDWDLRAGIDDYVGHFDFTGTRALDVGTASGYLTWEMERRGAEVVSIDRAPSAPYELVPYAGYDYLSSWFEAERMSDGLLQQQPRHPDSAHQMNRHAEESRLRERLVAAAERAGVDAFAPGKRTTFVTLRELGPVLRAEPYHPGWPALMNGYWYAHGANESRARVHYGTVHELPVELGAFDVAVFGAVLLHLRDPISALQSASRLVTDTIIVTEVMHEPFATVQDARMRFLPNPEIPSRGTSATWWRLSPTMVTRVLAMLGFEDSAITYHDQSSRGTTVSMFTVVAKRTAGTAVSRSS